MFVASFSSPALLPLEILVHIGIVSPEVWKDLLAVPAFARWTLSDHARKLRKKFLIVTINDKKITYYLGKKIHNFDDLPAIIQPNGTQERYQNGKRHRTNDKPAIILASGPQYWWQKGEIHRDNDSPAIICADGTQKWYKNGVRHRDNGPAVIYSNGSREWYKNGLPTIIFGN